MSELAIQLAMLNQQFSVKNRREEKILGIVTLILKIFAVVFIVWITLIIVGVIMTFLVFSSNTSDKSFTISESVMMDEVISYD